MSSKPFIIKTQIVEPTLPKDHEVFDPEEESKIQILQAINGYLTVHMGPLRLTWRWRAVRYFGLFGIILKSVLPFRICR